MPIYEYVCGVCGHELEVIQSIKESPLTQCPACNENALRKKLSAAAFHLKGTGWYETDFKNKKTADKESKKSDSNDGEKSHDGDSKSDGKKAASKSSDDKKASQSTSTST